MAILDGNIQDPLSDISRVFAAFAYMHKNLDKLNG